MLVLIAAFAWAGWANWEYRRQAKARAAADVKHAEMAADAAGNLLQNNLALMNKPAPAFTLETPAGQKVSLASYKGKAVLINFWATWCAPCKIETPWLAELRKQYGPQGFEVLGISADELDPDNKPELAAEKKAIAMTAHQLGITYPVLINADAISKSYGGLDELPTSFFVDRNGTVVATQVGLTSKSDIESNIRKALESRE